MKKILNQPGDFVDEMVEGILLAHPDQLKTPGDDRRIMVRADAPVAGKVGIVTGGGSGHLPLFKGYVGKGLCDGVAIGNVFSSPSSQQCFEATKAVSGGAGVLYLYGNYGGDVFNFDLAADLADLEDIPTRTVLGRDDVASQPKERKTDRRGVAGIVFAYKAAGAAAERGDSLDEVAAVAEDVVEHTATMGIGLSPTILPTTGSASFDLPDGEMEIGIGIHGEPGIHRGALETADAITDRIVDALVADLELARRATGSPAWSTVWARLRSRSSTSSTVAFIRYSAASVSRSPRPTSASTPPASKWPGRQSLCSLSTMTGWRCWRRRLLRRSSRRCDRVQADELKEHIGAASPKW